MSRSVSDSKKFKFLILAILLVFVGASSFAQSKTPQVLKWKEDPNVLEFKVEVQNTDTGKKQTLTTENNFVNVSLAPGKYRYKVTAYDFLGRAGTSSEWISFEVIKASLPKITPPVEAALASDENTLSVPVEVEDVSEESKVYIVREGDGKKIRGNLVLSEKSEVKGETGKANRAEFAGADEGKWHIEVENASGNKTVSEPFVVRNPIKEKRVAEEARKLEEERKEIERRRIEEERIAEERRIEEEARIAAEKRAAEEKRMLEEMARIEREKAEAEEKRLAEERLQEEKRLAEERLQEEKRLAEERLQEEKRIAELKLEEERLNKDLKLAEEKALEDEKELAKDENIEKNSDEEEKPRRARKVTHVTVAAGGGVFTAPSDGGIFDYSDSSFIPSLNARLTVLPLVQKDGKWAVGFEAAAFAERLTSSEDYYSVQLDIIQPEVTLVYRHSLFSLSHYWQIKGGGGFTVISENLELTEDSSSVQQPGTTYFGYPSLNAGFSLVFAPGNVFSLEFGADSGFIFSAGMNAIMLNPYVSIGFRF